MNRPEAACTLSISLTGRLSDSDSLRESGMSWTYLRAMGGRRRADVLRSGQAGPELVCTGARQVLRGRTTTVECAEESGDIATDFGSFTPRPFGVGGLEAQSTQEDVTHRVLAARQIIEHHPARFRGDPTSKAERPTSIPAVNGQVGQWGEFSRAGDRETGSTGLRD